MKGEREREGGREGGREGERKREREGEIGKVRGHTQWGAA